MLTTAPGAPPPIAAGLAAAQSDAAVDTPAARRLQGLAAVSGDELAQAEARALPPSAAPLLAEGAAPAPDPDEMETRVAFGALAADADFPYIAMRACMRGGAGGTPVHSGTRGGCGRLALAPPLASGSLPGRPAPAVMTDEDAPWGCGGTLIGKAVVLTAAHCEPCGRASAAGSGAAVASAPPAAPALPHRLAARPYPAGVSSETTGTPQTPYAVRVGLLRYFADQASEGRGRGGRVRVGGTVGGRAGVAASTSGRPLAPRLAPFEQAGKNYEFRLVSRVVVHPLYNPRSTAYDAALL